MLRPALPSSTARKRPRKLSQMGLRVVGIAMRRRRACSGLGGQQAAVLAKGAEEDAVEQLLGAAEDFRRGDGGVFARRGG